jgi:hypothetical protein
MFQTGLNPCRLLTVLVAMAALLCVATANAIIDPPENQ